jgi:hypothetical protein
MVRTATAAILLLLTAEVHSETIDVKYRGPVDLKTFECRDINRSSFIQRVCYDKPAAKPVGKPGTEAARSGARREGNRGDDRSGRTSGRTRPAPAPSDQRAA